MQSLPDFSAFAGIRAHGVRAHGIRAITIDLDDTLWPIWPTIERAERVLLEWLHVHAPATAQSLQTAEAVRAVRNEIGSLRPDLAHDLNGLRRESIRLALTRAGDDHTLAEAAFDTFFAERQRVELFEDALPALEFLSSRWPVVALSNGTADVHVVGLGRFFHASVSAHRVGFAKPDARIFALAAEAAGVPADSVLHIGDDAMLDVKGAMDAGMHAAWLNRAGVDWPHEGVTPHATVASLAQLCQGLAQG